MRVDLLSLFPEMLSGYLNESILRIAQEKNALQVHCHNIRDWTTNKHGKVDDRPFGGGPGMVLTCQPVIDAVRAVQALDDQPGRLLFLTPEGRPFTQSLARTLAEDERLILVCGRYEGFDQRIFEILEPERLCIGEFILTGGELPALMVVDAVTRLLPGVLGCGQSNEVESFNPDPVTGARLLDCPHYTQPAEYDGHGVPDILRSGDHAKIDAWRHGQALEQTRRFRPDLLPD